MSKKRKLPSKKTTADDPRRAAEPSARPAATQLPTVFVSIASYRDPDCQNTVKDLFDKASHPERVHIGICWQFVPGEDDDCFGLVTRPEQVRSINVHASESRGACWARHRVQELWQGEDYYFQIDSHMRFVQGWDEILITMLALCPAAKPVLSSYPLAFTPPDEFTPEGLVVITVNGFEENDHFVPGSSLISLNDAPAVPVENPFIGAGLLFAAGAIVRDVPYDPHLYFWGEEITLGVRLWTSGWDIFSPNKAIAWHDYGNRPDRPRHWKDRVDWGKLSDRAYRRMRHMLGIRPSTDPEDLLEIEKYGLGTSRTLAEFERYSGLDFRGHMYQGKPRPMKKVAADQPEQIEGRRSIFSHIWKENFWGCEETRSGHGSSLAQTAALRPWLKEVFRFLDIRIVADAGCGDLNWMGELAAQLRFYFGYDVVAELVDQLRERFAQRSNCFFAAKDVVMDTLPECDAIICRDCLTHLPLDASMMALSRFRQSGARYLIATTHSMGYNIRIANGAWFTMDLNAAPFNLPPPRLRFAESPTKSLGVWAMADLPA